MTQQKPPSFDAIVLHDTDNVATALHYLERGTDVKIKAPARDLVIKVCDCIPACHKFSLQALEIGFYVRKHGMSIGFATTAIDQGAHVHIHNLIGRDPQDR